MLRAYVAHMALRRTDWAIRHHPEDVPRQLDRAERLLDHYGASLALAAELSRCACGSSGGRRVRLGA